MTDADDTGAPATSGVYEVGVRSEFANVSVRVWCDMDARDGLGMAKGATLNKGCTLSQKVRTSFQCLNVAVLRVVKNRTYWL